MIWLIVFSIMLNFFIGNYFLADFTAGDGKPVNDEEINVPVPPDTANQDNTSLIRPLTEPSEEPIPPSPPDG